VAFGDRLLGASLGLVKRAIDFAARAAGRGGRRFGGRTGGVGCRLQVVGHGLRGVGGDLGRERLVFRGLQFLLKRRDRVALRVELFARGGGFAACRVRFTAHGVGLAARRGQFLAHRLGLAARGRQFLARGFGVVARGLQLAARGFHRRASGFRFFTRRLELGLRRLHLPLRRLGRLVG